MNNPFDCCKVLSVGLLWASHVGTEVNTVLCSLLCRCGHDDDAVGDGQRGHDGQLPKLFRWYACLVMHLYPTY